MFDYKIDELQKFNINDLMPSFFSDKHDKLLMNFV
jgi:hypothetical protein